ncbi:MAG: hypothetical protein RL726_47 [Actinomycetota bacterium]
MEKFLRTSGHVLGVLLLLAMAVVSFGLDNGSPSIAAPNQTSTKVTICHRTHSVTNPYRRITVAQSSIIGGANSKHGNAAGAHNQWSESRFGVGLSQAPALNVFSASHTYTPASDKKWGDIVPNVDVSGNPISGNFPGLNFTGDGASIYNGTGGFAGICRALTPTEYVQAEIASGYYQAQYPNKTPAEIEQEVMTELQEQEANEDVALKNALGGTFLGKTVSQFSAVSVVTDQPTSVVQTSATLNGTMTVGSTSTAVSFVWSLSSDCSNGTTVAGTPTPVTGTVAVTAPLTGLTANTTYYYKVVGTTNSGDPDFEGTIEGACVAFTTPAVGATTTTTTTTTPSTTTTTTTTVAPSSSSGVGGLRGSVWIDFDRDGVWDANEPALPGVSVQAVPQGVQNPVAVDLTTDSAGRFQASGLAPGSWKVIARLDSSALTKSWDTDGGTDWEVIVVVPTGGEAVADFAAHGTADVCVSNAPSDVRTLEYSWEGQDNSSGSSDDVEFSHQPSGSDTCVENVPTGDYQVDVLTPSGNRLRRLSVDVEPGVQRLNPVTGEVTMLALPATGSDQTSTQAWARVLVVVGLAVLWASRRRMTGAR